MRQRKRGTRSWNLLLVLVYLLLAGSLLANLVIVGAIPSLPQAGPALADAITRQTWDLHIYLLAGGWLNSQTGLGPLGVNVLEQALGPGVQEIRGNVSGALIHYTQHRYSPLHGVLQWLRWTPPACLVLALLLTLMRPRQVRSFDTN